MNTRKLPADDYSPMTQKQIVSLMKGRDDLLRAYRPKLQYMRDPDDNDRSWTIISENDIEWGVKYHEYTVVPKAAILQDTVDKIREVQESTSSESFREALRVHGWVHESELIDLAEILEATNAKLVDLQAKYNILWSSTT